MIEMKKSISKHFIIIRINANNRQNIYITDNISISYDYIILVIFIRKFHSNVSIILLRF